MLLDERAGEGYRHAQLNSAIAPLHRTIPWWPVACALGLIALSQLDSVQQNRQLSRSFIGAAAALGIWNVALWAWARRTGRTLSFTIVLRRQHYLQVCAQLSVLLYWGLYWRPVLDATHLIAAQVLFAYGVDMLLVWSRRETYTLGFGPVPVVFSINLFLWFKPDWFYFQFLMVALGFAAKEFIAWERDGRRAHIFNPSSFPLAIFSLALILTGTSGLTRGQEIASTQFYPPHMYLMLFLVGLPAQYFFGVASMTMSAVVTTYLFGVAYYAATGIYFFYDSYIPIAVFLGMHLLFTDPSTSPRTELGRIAFGVLYGLSTVALYQLLGSAGMPTFYDKLLQVPLLNLSVRWLDRVARSKQLHLIDLTAIGTLSAPHQRHLAYLFLWAIVFVSMSAVHAVGDDHPGQWLPFWRQACESDRPYACRYLMGVQAGFCDRGSSWSCHELDILNAGHGFNRSTSGAPTLDDYPIILRGSKGPIAARTPAALYALACRQGWPDTCSATSSDRPASARMERPSQTSP
jgi:hypothetical protein